MTNYLIKRILQAIVILLIISVLVFVFSRLSTDPMAQFIEKGTLSVEDRARLAEELGLNKPLPVQYLNWLGNVLRGDLGYSLFSKQSVWKLIIDRLPMTLILAVTAEIFTLLFAVIFSIIATTWRYSWIDYIITTISFIGYSMPVFLVGLLIMIFFSVQLKSWGLPSLPTGTDVWDHNNLKELAIHLILPTATLTLIQTARYSRFLRSSILEVMSNDYVRTATAYGCSRWQVLFGHILPNALLPVVSLVGLDIGGMLGGAVVTESIFSWPGMGRLFWEYALRGDFPVVNGILLLASAAVVFMTIITDVVYKLIDPRINLE